MEGSLITALNAAADTHANEQALIDGDKHWTFLKLKNKSDSFAAGLHAKGVKKGHRIALYCINGADFAASYMGIIKAGAVVVPVNLLQKPSEIQFILNDAGISGFIHHALFEANVNEIRQSLPKLLVDICIASEAENNVQTFLDNTLDAPVIEINPKEDLAAILYTSGTTAHPKGAMLTHNNLYSNTHSVFKAMKWKAGKDIITLVLPMFHAFAATVGMLTPLIHGCCILSLAKFDPASLPDAIERNKATIFLGVPSMYNALLNIKEEKVSAFGSIKYGISGGASMPVDVMRRFEEKFCMPIYEGDGPTECSPVTSVNPIDGERKVGTIGLPVPGVQMRILDEQGSELATGEIGEIAVRGPNVMKGYWNLPEATEESFIDNWFLTGDLGNVDEDGYFSILDRKKDMVIVNGMNVYPRIIEEVLYQFEPILEAAVIGEIDERHGEIPVAYVAIKEGFETSAADIRRWCRERLGSYEVPRRVNIIDALPKNAAGKIVKRVLRKHGEIERGIQ
ncbi:MAG: long-chain fatty acid--CoA ligase [Cycloclasticus sp. symbiont of Poecilosclerida sp. M]|nr:MAG: long-chain fatty acid--CoA ligase [Cycloclasticus sp. symbiont of Poecilosclerida sp. M]